MLPKKIIEHYTYGYLLADKVRLTSFVYGTEEEASTLGLPEEHFESLQTAGRNVQNVHSFHRNGEEDEGETSGANWN